MTFAEYVRAVTQRWPSGSVGLTVLRQTSSTHLLARRVVKEYADEGSWAPAADFLAWEQVAGRGRGDRSWASPPGGGVYASLIRPILGAATRAGLTGETAERPGLELEGISGSESEQPMTRPVPLQSLPLLVATALCETLNDFLENRCRLKWPNDLLVEGRKLAGVLIDVTTRGAEEALAIISFGVNYGLELPLSGSTSLENEAPGAATLDELAVRLVAAVDCALYDGACQFSVERYGELSLHREGDLLRCQAGKEEVEGRFRGFDRNGFLRLQVGSDERLLTAGEVTNQDGREVTNRG